ncbi:MAG: hypothetical protein ABI053_06650, partial [Lacisediminihabitans sp.]
YLVAQQAQGGWLDPRYRARHAQTVVDFGTSFSDSFGESVIRAVIHQLGYPAPELQVRFTDRQGHMDVDYFWRAEHECRVETGAADRLARNEDVCRTRGVVWPARYGAARTVAWRPATSWCGKHGMMAARHGRCGGQEREGSPGPTGRIGS